MRQIHVSIIVLAICLIWTVGGCRRSDNQAGSGNTISIDGSSTVFPISSLVMEIYRDENPSARLTVNKSGTGAGLEQFARREIEVCGASRPMKPSEIEACEAEGVGFVQFEVAYDGLAVVTSPENDWCDCLTVDQLKQIWTPENPINKWSEIDPSWPNVRIELYGPGTDSGTFDYFTEVIVGEAQRSRSDYTASEDDNMLVKGVANDKFALGYFGFAYYVENDNRLKLIGVDRGEGCLKPSPETIADNSYAPLSRPLFIYVRESSLQDPATADFVRFYIENAALAAKRVGYVPVPEKVLAENREKITKATQP